MSDHQLEIVVPCYNPEGLWYEDLVNNFKVFAESVQLPCRLILVNDGSTKGVSESDIRHIRNAIPNFDYLSYSQNRGKGYALRIGMAKAQSSLVITTDIDFPYTNDSMVAVYQELKAKGGLILGHRKKTYYRRVPLFRKLLSIGFRLIIKLFLKLEVDDTQCGLKGLDKEALQAFLLTKVDGYLFDLEFVKLITQENISINRVNATLKPSIIFTNMSPRILLREFSNLLKIVRS